MSRKGAEREKTMGIRQERRGEPRTELHRIWTVSVESHRFGHCRAQMLDYSASGMRLLLDGGSAAIASVIATVSTLTVTTLASSSTTCSL